MTQGTFGRHESDEHGVVTNMLILSIHHGTTTVMNLMHQQYFHTNSQSN